MKKILFILAALLALPMTMAAQKQAVGGQLDYLGKNRSVGVALFYQYRLSPMLRIAPDLGVEFRRKDMDAVYGNVNLQIPLNIGSGEVDLYPLAGVNLTRWNTHHKMVDMGGQFNFSNHYLRLGANIGAGFQYRMSANLLLKVEGKYVITKDFSTFASAIGVGYIF